MTYRGKVRNGVVVFEQAPDLPDGTEVVVQPADTSATPRPTLAELFADVIGTVPDLPPDMAAQHDHYLHGAPKR
jgi:hypothetical protein